MPHLPPSLSEWAALALFSLSFVTSMIIAMTLGAVIGSVLGGVIVSTLGMVVGAAGPLLAAFVRGIPDRRQIVATHATLNAFQHVFKVVVFVALGFAFRQYLALIAAMVVAGFAGTAVGSRLLTRVPERVFHMAFRVLLSLAAASLIRRAFM
jgi:uncharacterized protein